ncbi:MAG: ATP phosphoribosyltransferase regulatory subunit [Candidatus Shikimatogenerans bostrichidophilus]|nr:MAG: ATP phosphoribosyltransferase regulatory subunit [Candidatus Shikimatogenerans bostrichidophilus]
MNIFKNIKGTIDLFNKDIYNIENLIKIFKNNFILYGYNAIKTPSIENINIIKKIKNNINLPFIYKIKKNKFLIFDLTIPLIRFCLTNNNKIIFPFKRYQIQKVWRGEKPQNNRYREFYQCDVDIISFKSYLEEIEIILLCDKIFNNINLPIIFFINHKDILYGLCEYYKIPKKQWLFFINTIDKIDKLSKNIIIEILKKKINKIIIDNIFNFFKKKKKNINFLFFLKKKFKNNKYGKKGINYLLKIFKIINKINLNNIKVIFKINLSRGLNYYSKTIFEIKYKNDNISLGGGGRYDNLLKINNKIINGIGISFGLYRIYNIIKKLNIKIKNKRKKKLIFLNFGKENFFIINKYASYLRNKNIIIEIFPYKEKIKKQIKYAIFNKYNFLIIIGKKEIKKKIFKIKNLKKKKEIIFKKIKELINYIK